MNKSITTAAIIAALFSLNLFASSTTIHRFDTWKSQDTTKTWTPPSATDTLVGRASTDTLSNKSFSDAITGAQISTPSNPSSGNNKLYFKSDNNLYMLNSSGTETQVNSSGAGSPSTGSGYYNATTSGSSPFAQWTYSVNSTSFTDPTTSPSTTGGVSFTDGGGSITLSALTSGTEFRPGFTASLGTHLYFVSATFGSSGPAGDWLEWALTDGSGTIIDSGLHNVGGSGDAKPIKLSGIYSATSGTVTFKIMCKDNGGAYAGNVIDSSGDPLNHMARAINFSIFQIK